MSDDKLREAVRAQLREKYGVGTDESYAVVDEEKGPAFKLTGTE
jgi:hypothetical protein